MESISPDVIQNRFFIVIFRFLKQKKLRVSANAFRSIWNFVRAS